MRLCMSNAERANAKVVRYGSHYSLGTCRCDCMEFRGCKMCCLPTIASY